MISLEKDTAQPLPSHTLPESERLVDSSSFWKLLKAKMHWSAGSSLNKGFLSLADQAIASGTNFVTGVIIARASSKEEFGLYMLGFTIILLVTDLQTSLIATPYMVYVPKLKGRQEALYAGSTLLHQAGFSIAATMCAAVAACVIHIGIGPVRLEPVLWTLAAVLSFIMLREFFRRMCFARLRTTKALVFDSCVGALQIGGLLLLTHFRILTASRAYWAIGAACGTVTLLWLLIERKLYEVRLNQALKDLQKNWAFGRWVFASGLIWSVSTNLYPWMIAFFQGAASAGVFAACMGVVSASNPALLGLQNFIGPKIAHESAMNGPAELRRLVLRISRLLAVPVSILAICLILWGDRLISLLYGSKYAGNGFAVAILAINLVVTTIAYPFSRALFAIERANVDFALNLAAIVIMMTVGSWLVKSFGPLGAAYGLLLANVVTSVARAWAFLSIKTAEVPIRSFPN